MNQTRKTHFSKRNNFCSLQESNSGKPTYLQLGTKVLAKYNGTFREAKIKKLIRCVKCKVTFKNDYVPLTVTDEDIRGEFRVGATVETKHPERNVFCEAIINNIIDHSQYIVVFDDSNEITLKTSLCLKSGNPGLESKINRKSRMLKINYTIF